MNEFGCEKYRPKKNSSNIDSFWDGLKLSRTNSSIDNINKSYESVSRMFRTTNDSSFLGYLLCGVGSGPISCTSYMFCVVDIFVFHFRLFIYISD